MAETYNRLHLDVNVKPGGIITAVQKDSDSRYLDVTLYNNGVPIDLTGHEVRIYMRKPENGGEVFNNGEITEPKNGRCQFLLTTAALEKTGHLQTQVSIWKDNHEILSTQVFEIMVTESLRTTGSIEGSNEYGALVVLFQNLYESMDLMTEMVQNFGRAGTIAAGIPADTFWKMLEAVYSVAKDALENSSVQGVLDRIGTTKDTGGTPKAGTVFAKENTILNSVKGIQASMAQKGALKETGTKRVSYPITDSNKVMEFDFGKEVQFVALYMKPKLSTDIYGNAHTIYFINGENSLHTTLKFLSTSEFVYPVINIGNATALRTSGLLFGLSNSLGENAALFQFPIYVTKIRIEFVAAALKSNYVDLSVAYIG